MPIQILQGTLDLMILRILATMGPQHAYGIANRLQQVSEDALNLNQGTIYPALVRIEQHGWTRGSWGRTESNREGNSARGPGTRDQIGRARVVLSQLGHSACRIWRRIVALELRCATDGAREVASRLAAIEGLRQSPTLGMSNFEQAQFSLTQQGTTQRIGGAQVDEDFN